MQERHLQAKAHGCQRAWLDRGTQQNSSRTSRCSSATQPARPQPPRRNSDSRTGPPPPTPSGLGAPFAGAPPDPLLLLSLSLLSPSFRLRFFRFRSLSLSLLFFSLVLLLRLFLSALSAFRFLTLPSVTCGRKHQGSLLLRLVQACKAGKYLHRRPAWFVSLPAPARSRGTPTGRIALLHPLPVTTTLAAW